MKAYDNKGYLTCLPGLIKLHWGALLASTLFLLFQAYLGRHCEPVVFPDSDYYLELAAKIRLGDWSNFAFRTPGYPLFLSVLQASVHPGSLRPVVVAQLALGCLTPLFLYIIFWKATGSRWISAAASLVPFWDSQNLLMQQLILTEGLTTALLLATLAIYLIGNRTRQLPLAVALGGMLFMLTMVRPSFQLLHWVLAIVSVLCGWRGASNRRQLVRWNLTIALVAQILLLGWSAKIFRDTGHFSISLLSGTVLMSHAGPHVQNLPAGSFDPWRTEYLAGLKSSDGYAYAVFPALKRLKEVHGLSAEDAALGFSQLSRHILINNPASYARSAWETSLRLLVEPTSGYYRGSSGARYLYDSSILSGLYRFSDQVFWGRPTRIWGLAFLTLAAGMACMYRWRSQPSKVHALALVIVTIVYTVAIHSAVNTADLGRYRLPIQPLLFSLTVVLVLWGLRCVLHACALRHTHSGRTK